MVYGFDLLLAAHPGALCRSVAHFVKKKWIGIVLRLNQCDETDIFKTLERALCVRHVEAGSCNECELELHALGNRYYNLEGLGIRFVANPRHADILLVTGHVSVNAEQALKLTDVAVPDPKKVIAVGDCTCCGGIFGDSYATRGSVANVIPASYRIAGCPPTPAAIPGGALQNMSARVYTLATINGLAKGIRVTST